jgi:hypothetical protein
LTIGLNIEDAYTILYLIFMLNPSASIERNPCSAILPEPKISNPADVVGSSEGGFATVACTVPPKPTLQHECLWCGRTFTLRLTGGSAQKFCSTGHRQAFWIAARRWTMRAIETGLLSVDCLKAAQASVHAAVGAFRRGRQAGSPA